MIITVSRLTQEFGQERRPIRPDASPATLLDARQGVPSDLLSVVTRQQGSPSGPASPGVVELSESQSVCGQSVQVRRVNFSSVATQVGIAHVIHQDDQKIGLLGFAMGMNRNQQRPKEW